MAGIDHDGSVVSRKHNRRRLNAMALGGQLLLTAVAVSGGIGISVANLLTTPAIAVAATPSPPVSEIKGDRPAPVAQGTAHLDSHHDPNHVLRINVGLAIRDSDGLDRLIRSTRMPGNPQYGRYLTNEQFKARYAPTDAEVAAARTWLTQQGLEVMRVAPDNLLISATGKIGQLEDAFGVTINDYDDNGRAFYSNDRDPQVRTSLNVTWISGLDNFSIYRVSGTPAVPALTNVPAVTNGALDGGDFRKAYDVSGDGAGRTIGFTLWGRTLPQSDYDGYATATGTTKLTVGGAGNDGLVFVQVGGASTISNTDGEVALDTEVAHAMAPSIHETYWLGVNNSGTTLENVINAAANSGVPAISNSWECDGCSIDANMESSFKHAVSVGSTFYFSSGDNGAAAGRSYPAVSQYVVAVGGTNLSLDSSSNYVSETAWSGSGGGCDNSEPRPSWQTGIGSPLTYPNSACTGRAEPDVATDSSTCAYVFVDGGNGCLIGTSLSAPLWAAMATVWDNNNAAHGRPSLGFSAPLIYALANDSTTYARDFHDITSGSNGFSAGAGWDEVTGWGSPDFNKISNNVADVTYTGPTQASKGDMITLSATLLDHNASTTLATAALGTLQVSLAAAGSSCVANVDGTGHASCAVTINNDPGHYSAIAAYAGDAAYQGGSNTVAFTVLHIPTKITYTGPTTGDYNDPVNLSATLTESITGGSAIAGRTLSFTLGAESCSALTNGSGVASCSVTPLDVPGPHPVSVSFAGESPLYEPSSTSSPFTVAREESQLVYTGPLTSHYHDALTAAATMTDPVGGAPIAGKTVTFTLGAGDTCSAVTDGSGHASCSITPHQTGTKNMVASFGGDTFYLASSDIRAFSISPEETTIHYTGPTVILAGAGGATLTATLVEDGAHDSDGDGGSAAPNPAEMVTLSIGSQSCTGMTDSFGHVTCTIPSVTVPLGPETVTASFAGDAFYQAATDSTTAIVFAFPSRGAFAVGDVTIAAAGGTTVEWWGDIWSQLNVLSGGSAPPAFKGFEEIINLPNSTPANVCSGTWMTTGGNSPPPASDVPSYMGVVVTSSVDKTGSDITGDYTHIVVVKVDPGYAPTPDHPGTGTIVATFC